ncbi:YitT family protein [Sphingomonas mollis]|uniref:YitT family protein n=1 Tax=Sphingomonas mollis TaxID=2795726 RepID=A0ABS0XMH9_9SPHN|nr:YitT family protein [Sphingomonas sp. BT553]MBJ6121020.1 YitT family protein [Sphingomonas sp. BT553]
MQPRLDSLPIGRPHSVAEDAYALAIGCILLVLGLVFLKSAGLVTGGIAGVALLLSYLIPLPAGVLFTIINVPFFAFAHKALGARFAIKTVLVNVGIATFSSLTRVSIHVMDVQPAFAAIVGGTLIGMGILCLARHQAGVGGTGVITLWLQRTRGWNAGSTQIVLDVLILSAAIPVVSGVQLGWSILSAAAISLILIAWHRPGRYIGH